MCVEPGNDSERISRVIFNYAARIVQAHDINSLLQLNADMGRDLIGAERCSIWLIDDAAGQLYTTVAHGTGEIRLGVGHGLVGACIVDNEPVVVNNASSDERFFGCVDRASGFVTQSALAIPLRVANGKVIAVHIKVPYREEIVRELRDLNLPQVEIGECEKEYTF